MSIDRDKPVTRTLEVKTFGEFETLNTALRRLATDPTQAQRYPEAQRLHDRFNGRETTEAPAVHTNTREQARALWVDYSETYRAPVNWKGDIGKGNPGTLSEETIAAILRRINYYRAMAGVPPVANDDTLNPRCQAAAMYISANPKSVWDLSHTLDPSRPHYTAMAAEAARNSLIDRDSEGTEAIADYMRDWSINTENEAVPHRQWLLLPQLRTVGIGAIPAHGQYTAASCIYVATPTTAERGAVMWPTPGAFPYQITPERWSVYSPGSLSGSSVTVNGKAVPSKAYPAIGGSILVFQPPYPFLDESSHAIQIAGPQPMTYTVERFKP